VKVAIDIYSAACTSYKVSKLHRWRRHFAFSPRSLFTFQHIVENNELRWRFDFYANFPRSFHSATCAI